MITYTDKGTAGEGPVYVLETLADFDTYEKILGGKDMIMKYNPVFYKIKDEFRKRIGSIWEDTSKARYEYEGRPVYAKYTVIAIEDNTAFLDWYWVMRNRDDERDIRYVNINDI